MDAAGTYFTAADSRASDAIETVERIARGHGIKLEFQDWKHDDSGKSRWTLTFDAWPEEVGAAIEEAGATLRRAGRKTK